MNITFRKAVLIILSLLISNLMLMACESDDYVILETKFGDIQLTAPHIIREKADNYRPLNANEVPSDLPSRVGTAHFSGRYHLTDDPILKEGVDQIADMGMRVVKLWFTVTDKNFNGYYFNSDWPSITPNTRLVDLAKMEHYREGFENENIDSFVMITATSNDHLWRRGADGLDSYYKDEEEQIYELAKYLLETYADREVTFVFQNWEGDWLLRANSANTQWERNPDSFVPDNVDDRIAGMIRWFNTRQDGVNRARKEIQDTKATVAHAIEVNKVWWPERKDFQGNYAPILVTHVLPHVNTDLVLWSAYDSVYDNPVSLWQGIEVIRHFAQPSELYGENNVAIGEYGIPVQQRNWDAPQISRYYDQFMGAAIALELPYVLHWILYCNEVMDDQGNRIQNPDFKRAYPLEELRGYFLVKPDGSYSVAGQYFYDTMQMTN